MGGLDGHGLGLVKLIRRGPDGVGHIHGPAGGFRIEVIVRHTVDGGGELLPKGNDAHHGEHVSVDLHAAADGVVSAEQTGLDRGIHQQNLAEILVVVLVEAPAPDNLIAVHAQVIRIDAVHAAGEGSRLVVHAFGILSAGVQGDPLHAGNVQKLLFGILGDDPHPVGDAVPAHVVGIAVLVQLHRHHVISGTDEVLLDLLVGALDGGDDGDDGSNADDDAQHGQNAAHFVAPNALEGQTNILDHFCASLVAIEFAQVTGLRRRTGHHVLPVGEGDLVRDAEAGANFIVFAAPDDLAGGHGPLFQLSVRPGHIHIGSAVFRTEEGGL